jgi:HipA-like protein
MLIVPKNIIGVDVFLERFQTRVYVGKLKKVKKQFHFCYDPFYLRMENILSLGPEFPLTQQEFFSEKLFPSFLDRLPDPENASYKDYCTAAKIPVTITDPLILLATVGKRGPSSFIFEPVYKNEFNFQKVEQFITGFDLSLQDFALLFDVSLSILQKIKAGKTSGREILKRLEICLSVPEALVYQIQKNRKWLHPKKLEKLDEFLNETQMQKGLKENHWKILTAEVNFTQNCLKGLQACFWIKPLIEKINQQGFTEESMPLLFEVRFAHNLYTSGFEIGYEYQAGVGKSEDSKKEGSSVDFLVKGPNGVKWLIELTSLAESEEVKKNTKRFGDFLFYESRICPADTKNNQESLAIIKAQGAILSKVAKLNKETGEAEPTKFPLPEHNQYHIILIDMRGFLTGTVGDDYIINILYGNNVYKNQEARELYARFFIAENGEKKAILGIFDSSHPDKRAKYLQERIHGVGFICEKNYKHDEIQERLILFHNPKLFKTREELINLWPIKKEEK